MAGGSCAVAERLGPLSGTGPARGNSCSGHGVLNMAPVLFHVIELDKPTRYLLTDHLPFVTLTTGPKSSLDTEDYSSSTNWWFHASMSFLRSRRMWMDHSFRRYLPVSGTYPFPNVETQLQRLYQTMGLGTHGSLLISLTKRSSSAHDVQSFMVHTHTNKCYDVWECVVASHTNETNIISIINIIIS